MISIEECKDQYFYRISSRNLGFGVYNEENKGFTGIRKKFDFEYLATEYHWDTGAPFGTVMPLFEIKPCPIKRSKETEQELFDWIVKEAELWFTELYAHIESLKEAMEQGKTVCCNKSASLKNETHLIRKVLSFSNRNGFGRCAEFEENKFVEISDCSKDNFYISE